MTSPKTVNCPQLAEFEAHPAPIVGIALSTERPHAGLRRAGGQS